MTQEEKELLLQDLKWVDMETNECHCYNCKLFDSGNNVCKCIDLCKNPRSTFKGFFTKYATKQENKELLLKDLCARLPYGVKIHRALYGAITLNERMIESFRRGLDDMLIPYLRPLSSITEEEYDDMFHQLYSSQEEFFRNCSNTDTMRKIIAYDMVRYDWLNKKMFDYRGLIQMGLAFEALEGMYNN